MHWTEQRSMGPIEYANTIRLLKMSQSAAGRFLGVSARTSRRYIRGEADIPPAQVLLLRAVLALEPGVRIFVPRYEKGGN